MIKTSKQGKIDQDKKVIIIAMILAISSLMNVSEGQLFNQGTPGFLKLQSLHDQISKIEVSKLQKIFEFSDLLKSIQKLQGQNGLFACNICWILSNQISMFFKDQPIIENLESIAEKICEIGGFVKNTTVCHSAVKEMGDIIVPILSQSLLSPDYFCTQIISVCESPHFALFTSEEYVKQLLSDKPSNLQDDDFLDKIYNLVNIDKNPRKTIKIVQISDPHIDFYYTSGTIADCNMPLCCRPENGFTTDPERAAGEWGNYRCDLPHKVLVHMLEYVKEEIQPEIFFWTGDNSAHNIWSNNADEVIAYTTNITNTIKQIFTGENIAVYPIQGNHDTYPVNVQSFDKPGDNKFISTYKILWEEWLDAEALSQFEKFGYYSQNLKNANGQAYENTKLICVNSQSCNNQNWFLWKDKYDPGNQIDWLENELRLLEKTNGQAIILSHIPTGDDCLHAFGERFRGLMDRFQSTIRFSLYGHTHKESFNVVKSIYGMKNIGINFIAGSMTTFVDYNPSFTVIEVDQEYMLPMNFKTYYFNITRANQGQPQWELLHDFVEHYEIPDVSPNSLEMLAQKILQNEQMALMYLWNEARRAKEMPTSCDENCRKELYCLLTSTEQFQLNKCRGVSEYDFLSDPLNAFMNFLSDPWTKIDN